MSEVLDEDLADARALVRRAWARGLAPPPTLSVWEWAEAIDPGTGRANRRLSSKGSAEPGDYDSSRTPYTREIQEALSDSSPVIVVVFIKAAQISGTESALNFIGYSMDLAPAPILYVLPTLEVAQRVSRQRIEPMIRDSASLSKLVREPRSRDASNTVLLKEFPGGFLILGGANSAAGLRSTPARKLILDDLDAFETEISEEGNPIDLAERATLTFGKRRKILKISTPTIEGRSAIVSAWDETDQRFYHVPCPGCGDYSPMAFSSTSTFVVGARKHLVWEEKDGRADLASVRLACQACGRLIEEWEKTSMLAAGRWVPTRPVLTDERRGYHISSLYSPIGWVSWSEIVEMFESTKKNPSRLRVFVNQRLGEPYREKGDAPPWESIYRRRERYTVARVPRKGLLLTAGVDVQQDRLELEVVAWGRGEESWSVDYQILVGTPEDSATWDQLRAALSRSYPHESGAQLGISMACVDSGYATQFVYAWARKQDRRRLRVTKGREGGAIVVSTPTKVEVAGSTGKRLRRGLDLWTIGVDHLKGELYARLRLEPPLNPGEDWPSGYCHFPEYGEEYFKQLTGEQLISRVVRGFRRYQWEKVYERNEALDCRVYNMAAAAMLGLPRWSEERWRELELSLGSPPPPEAGPGPAPAGPRTPPRPPPQPAGGGSWARPRGGRPWMRR